MSTNIPCGKLYRSSILKLSARSMEWNLLCRALLKSVGRTRRANRREGDLFHVAARGREIDNQGGFSWRSECTTVFTILYISIRDTLSTPTRRQALSVSR